MTGPLRTDDLVDLPTLGDARISPDGHWVAYVRRTANWEENRFDRRVWVSPSAGGPPIAATGDLALSGSPRWNPQTVQLAAVGRAVGESLPAVYQIDPATGDAQPLASAPAGAHSFQWAPDGMMLCCLALEQPRKSSPAADVRTANVRVVGDHGPAVQLWGLRIGETCFRPLSPAGLSVKEVALHPDGAMAVLVASWKDQGSPWDKQELYLLNLQGGECGSMEAGPGCVTPVWNPDGSALAFIRLGTPSYCANPHLEILELDSGRLRRPLAWDEEIRPVVWRNEGIYFLSLVHADGHLFRLDVRSGEVRQMTPKMEGGFALLEGWGGEGCVFSTTAKMSAVVHTRDHPGDVALLDLGEGGIEFLTDNASAIKAQLPATELVTWTSSDGVPIEGVVHRPRSAMEPRNAPLVLALHGGPTALSLQAPFADSDWRLSAIPLLVQMGAVVLRPNYRGGAGYGESFRMANVGRLGDVGIDDAFSGADELVRRGWCDANRIAASGMSHGGYLAAYFATATRRLRAAVVQAGISDWAMNYCTNGSPDWETQYFGAPPWNAREAYARLSPLSHVSEQSAPMLILHGEDDQQAPVVNALALYRGLKDHNVPCRLVLYPNTGHGPSRPRELRHHMSEVVEWLREKLVLATDYRL